MASVRARLLSEARTLVCTKCGKYVEVKRIHELEEKPKCPECGSASIGLIERGPEEVWRVLELLERSPEKGKQSKVWKEVQETSKLISRYGKLAAIVLVGRGISPSEAGKILEEEDRLSDRLLELVLRKEREALLQRYKLG